ncbi:MAG: sensor histidine kinase [Myxococcota bacterium]
MNYLSWNSLLGLSFGALVVSALAISWQLQLETDAENARNAEQSLSSIIQVAENSILQQAENLIQDFQIPNSDKPISLPKAAWIESLYLWSPQPKSELYFPKAPPPSDISDYPPQNCLSEPQESAEDLPCREASATYAIFQSMALAELQSQQDPLAAATLLNSPKFSIRSSLKDGLKLGIPPLWILKRQLLMLELEKMGAPKLNILGLIRSEVLDIVELNPRALAQIMPALAQLPISILEDNEYQSALIKALRTTATLKTVEQILSEPVPIDSNIQVRGAPYGARPYLLIYQKQVESDFWVGLQIHPQKVLDALYETLEASNGSGRIVLLDAESRLLPDQSSPLNDDEYLWIQAPFGKLFPHLRVGLIMTQSQPVLSPQLLVSMSPVLIGVVLGIFAIFGRIKADRYQSELLDRQQAFIARVTHELKTPLAGIRLMAESLQLGVIESPEQGQIFTSRILLEADRLEDRINEVLQVAKRAELRIRVLLDMSLLCREILHEWQPRFHEVDGILRLNIEDDHTLFGDEDLIKDAMRNLLSNAIKYQNESRQLRCELSVIDMGSFTEISVSDNGIGVPLAYRRSIFERFVRVEGPHRGLSGGHGLGLSFVAEAASAHGGSVRCTEGFNGGSKFIMRLPNSKE